MEKFKHIKKKITDFLCKINDYYADHLWLRISLTIFYYFILIFSLLVLTGYWMGVFDNSICGEDILCCILSYFLFYTIMLHKVD